MYSDTPASPPPAFAALAPHWPRAAFVLRHVAWGHGINPMIGDWFAREFDLARNSGTFKATVALLERTGLIESQVRSLNLGGGGRACAVVKLVEFSPAGAELAHSLGWQILPTEWQILRQRHSADLHPEHALAVVLFARQADAYLKSFVICPDTPGHYKPDLMLHEIWSDVQYVEVERGDGNEAKWRANAVLNGGVVHLVALNPQRMMSLVRDVQALRLEVEAANLRDLLYGRADWLWSYPPD